MQNKKLERIAGYESLKKSVEDLASKPLYTDKEKREIFIRPFRKGLHLYNLIVLREMFDVAADVGVNIPKEERRRLFVLSLEQRALYNREKPEELIDAATCYGINLSKSEKRKISLCK